MRSLALLLALLVAPAVAHAETKEAPQTPTRWYGWQLLAVDAASITTFSLVTYRPESFYSDTAWYLAAGTYLLTGSIAHAVHRNWDAAIMSLPARAVVPFAAGLVGMGVRCKGHTPGAMDDDCAGRGFMGGLLVGAVALSALEAGLVSYEKAPEKPTITPTASLSPSGATLGFVGAF